MLVLDSVTKSYVGQSERLTAVDAVSLVVESGRTAALVGPSGCGKSTLLRMMAGLLAPDRGVVHFHGAAPVNHWRSGRIGLALQVPALLPWRTVEQNIALPLELRGDSMIAVRQRTAELLELFGLASLARRLPEQLSGGQQQRVAVARALAATPQLLLLDEPFSGVDELTREQLQFMLHRALRQQQTRPSTIIVTHSIAEAVFLCDHIFVLSDRAAGRPAEVSVQLPPVREMSLRDDPQFAATVSLVRRELSNPTLDVTS
jgi:NitT/TauT family transport system ATP-binding protein